MPIFKFPNSKRPIFNIAFLQKKKRCLLVKFPKINQFTNQHTSKAAVNHSTARAPCCLPQNLFCPVFCGNPLSARQSVYAKTVSIALNKLVIWLTPSMWRSRDGLSTILPKLLLLHQVVYIWGLTFFGKYFICIDAFDDETATHHPETNPDGFHGGSAIM